MYFTVVKLKTEKPKSLKTYGMEAKLEEIMRKILCFRFLIFRFLFLLSKLKRNT